MKWLQARYPSGAAFLDHYQTDFPHGGIVVPTRARVAVGDDALVAVRFPELQGEVCLRGFVAWQRASDPKRGLKGGVAVELIQGDETRRDFILRVARGEISPEANRKHRRIPLELRVEVRALAEGARTQQFQATASSRKEREARPPSAQGASILLNEIAEASAEDVSHGGMFIRCTDPPPPGTSLVLRIMMPQGAGCLELAAKVRWVRGGARPGMGVAFTLTNAGSKRMVAELLRRIESEI